MDVPVKVAATGFALVDPINICPFVSADEAIFLLASRYIADEAVLADKVRSLDKVRELKPGLEAAGVSREQRSGLFSSADSHFKKGDCLSADA